MASSMFTRPFTYLPARPRPESQVPVPVPSFPFEEHFINITLDDTYDASKARHPPGEKSGTQEEWITHCKPQPLDYTCRANVLFTRLFETRRYRHIHVSVQC
jgi:hypothetical protein